jgi:hypothetical protein
VNQRRGEGSWLGVLVVAVLLFAKPAAGAATPPHHQARPEENRSIRTVFKAAPSSTARAEIPPAYLALYRASARACPGLPWGVLAGIGKVETNHGRSTLPGVRSGVNRFGCCAGPMQFNLRNGPPSTWDAYGHGGDPYDPKDAIPAAARLLCRNGARGGRDVRGAVFAYNHAGWYVDQVLALARSYQAEGR